MLHTILLICAAAGGTVLLLQLGLSLLGFGLDHSGFDFGGDLGHGHDVALDHGHSLDADAPPDGHHDLWQLGRLITFQTVVAFVTFFGVGGLAALDSGQDPAVAAMIAVAVGLGAMVLLGLALRSLRRLQNDGTVRLASAAGVRGQVYLRVPGGDSGVGKVTLPVQGRLMEVLARTPGPELHVGEEVAVCRALDGETVEVVAAAAYAEKPVPIPE